MSANGHDLSEKEKQTLRLIVRGHDAKSLARHLDLSVHTINERLRDARRKLGVSSSREAARILLEREHRDPENYGDTKIGEGTPPPTAQVATSDPNRRPANRPIRIIAGAIIMSVFIGIIALSLLAEGQPAAAPATSAPADAGAQTESDTVRAARDWLALSDEGRWNDGWQQAAASFRKANTPQRWADAATQVRVPMGALVSRTLLSQESVPAPPGGVEVVKFRTSFANRPSVLETVSLIREGDAWRVNGIYVE